MATVTSSRSSKCSFCGKQPREIVFMIGARDGGAPQICNECLYLGMAALAHSDEIDFDTLASSAKQDESWRDFYPAASSSSGDSGYKDIDPTIQEWVERNRLALQTEWEGEARFWYTSRGTETYQVSVSPPQVGLVRVDASAVETDDDAELEARWEVRPDDLGRTLVLAADMIDFWHRRPRASA